MTAASRMAAIGMALAAFCAASAWAKPSDEFVYRVRPGDSLYSLRQALVSGQPAARTIEGSTASATSI